MRAWRATILAEPTLPCCAPSYPRRRCNRVRTMVVASLADAALVAALALVRRPEQAWLLYVLLAAQFTGIAFYDPVRRGAASLVGTCCAVLCCAVLCCAVLCCAVLCCAVLHHAVLCSYSAML